MRPEPSARAREGDAKADNSFVTEAGLAAEVPETFIALTGGYEADDEGVPSPEAHEDDDEGVVNQRSTFVVDGLPWGQDGLPPVTGLEKPGLPPQGLTRAVGRWVEGTICDYPTFASF